MRARRKVIDRVAYEWATSRGRDNLDTAIRRAKAVEFDEDRVKRLQQSECKSCFYLTGRMGGAAMTAAQCGICDAETVFGSTCTDAICQSCAKKHNLCAHCGGDLELRPRRRDFKFLDELKPTNKEE